MSKMFYIILAGVIFILFSLYGFWQAIHPPRYITNLTPKDLGWEFEEISLNTTDGIKLAAWMVPFDSAQGKPSDKVIILLHGYPADKANLLEWAEFLHQDFNLFFLDFRYFGDSEGKLTTIGHHEQKDLKAALDYLEKRNFKKIGAMGFSLGGAVAILTAAKDNRIEAIVSDSAFANLDLMANEFYKPLWILKYPLTLLTKIWAQIFLGINADQISPEKAAQNLKIPILLIHAKKDATIPFENALRLQKSLANNLKAKFLFLEEGTHGFLPDNVQIEYQEKVLRFFSKNL